MSFVFEPDLDGFSDLRRERLEVLAVFVVDVGIRCRPDRIDDAVDDAPAAGFQALLSRQQDSASERVDCLVAFDEPEFGVAEPLVAEAGDEDPLQRSRPPVEFLEEVLGGLVALLFLTDSRLDFVTCLNDRLQHVDEVAPAVADSVSEPGDVIAVAVALTPDSVRRDVP